jgi:hypothetical protein
LGGNRVKKVYIADFLYTAASPWFSVSLSRLIYRCKDMTISPF